MQKLNIKYFLWKLLIYFLLVLMVLPLSFPAFLIVSKSVGEDGRRLAYILLSCGAFIVFLLYQNWLMRRSDLSKISLSKYLVGESVAFSVYAALGAVLYGILSGALTPGEIGYANVVFLPFYPASLLVGHIVFGALIMIALYPLCILLLYSLKKKSDPSLRGRKGKEAPGGPLSEQPFSPDEGVDTEDTEKNDD